jgi:Putative peptidoglycan binding domain
MNLTQAYAQENNLSEPRGPAEIVKRLTPPQPGSFEEFPNPPIPSENIGQLEKNIEETYGSPPLPSSNETVKGPAAGSEAKVEINLSKTMINTSNISSIGNTSTLNASNGANINATVISPSSDIRILRNHSVTAPLPSLVDETAVAKKAKTVFFTGNWFAARSIDNGQSWTYVDPTSDMSTFCCDQDVLYDVNHDIFIWYRQGDKDANLENIAKLGISHDATNWWFYEIRPTDLNVSWKNQWFDYPHMALGNNYLYITSNIFSDKFQRSVIMRISLNDLANAVAPEFTYYQDTPFTFTPIQGATDTMYWASHLSTSAMRLYKWSEALPWTGIQTANRSIPAWSMLVKGQGQCPSIGGNWCGRADYRITSGWIQRGPIGNVIGFLWNANSGGITEHGATFKWPYINAATFRASDLNYIGRPYVWSPNFAWLYGFASPHDNGDLAIMAYFGDGQTIFPSLAAGVIRNNVTASPWNLVNVKSSTNVPAENKWGDYIRVRPDTFATDGALAWAAAGFTLQGGSSGQFIQPLYFTFGVGGTNLIPLPSDDLRNIEDNGNGPLKQHDPNPRPTLVIHLQMILKKLGFGLGNSGPNHDGIDGIFGPNTETAVINFQQNNTDLTGTKLKVDGMVGKLTAQALNKAAGI